MSVTCMNGITNSHARIQIDTAIMYGNEKGSGRAVKNSGLDRSELFLTTKIPPGSMGYERSKRAIESSLKEAGQQYFDLYESSTPVKVQRQG